MSAALALRTFSPALAGSRLARIAPALAALPGVGALIGGIGSLLELLPPIVLAVPKHKVTHSRKSMRSAHKGIKNRTSELPCGRKLDLRLDLESWLSSCEHHRANKPEPRRWCPLPVSSSLTYRLHQLPRMRHCQARTQPLPVVLLADLEAVEVRGARRRAQGIKA
jgi:large subunit ribosomal protein L32